MSQPKRRLPEDSVVTSLSEIQAILQAGRSRPKVAAPPTAPPETKPAATGPVENLGPVPSAAELRATREARWQEDMHPPAVVAAPPPRRAWPWVGGLVGVAGIAVGVFFTVGSSADNTPPAVDAPDIVAPVAETPQTAPPRPVPPVAVMASAAPAPGSSAPTVASGSPSRKVARSRSKTGHADPLDAVLGPRHVSQSRPTPHRAKVTHRKRTKADAQLDGLLDRL